MDSILNKVKNIGIFAGITALAAVGAYLGGLDTTALFGVTGGAVASFIIGFGTREGLPRLTAYLENYAKD